MDPAIANRDFRPPREPGLPRGLLPAILVNIVLIAALAWGVHWRLGANNEVEPVAPEPTTSASIAAPSAPPTGTQESQVASPKVATARMGAGMAAAPAVEERESVADDASQEAPEISEIPPRGKKKARNAAASPARRGVIPQPSFDCAKARSFAERTICSDAELAQLDRDLGRLHARAKQAAADPAAFRRQNDAEWRRRERTCRDRSCLVRWYAERRQQLTQSLNQASRQGDRTAKR